jgi:hypothetical protein
LDYHVPWRTALHDPRNQDRITHELRDLVAQRLYALCCGYEDLNDHTPPCATTR